MTPSSCGSADAPSRPSRRFPANSASDCSRFEKKIHRNFRILCSNIQTDLRNVWCVTKCIWSPNRKYLSADSYPLISVILPSYPFTSQLKITLRRCCRVANAFEILRNAANDNLNSVTRWRGHFPLKKTPKLPVQHYIEIA